MWPALAWRVTRPPARTVSSAACTRTVSSSFNGQPQQPLSPVSRAAAHAGDALPRLLSAPRPPAAPWLRHRPRRHARVGHGTLAPCRGQRARANSTKRHKKGHLFVESSPGVSQRLLGRCQALAELCAPPLKPVTQRSQSRVTLRSMSSLSHTETYASRRKHFARCWRAHKIWPAAVIEEIFRQADELIEVDGGSRPDRRRHEWLPLIGD
jgi:hypothetical protein